MSVELRIRREFNESPSQVIKGLAALGYGKKATAQVIGIERNTLKKLAKRYGIEFLPYKLLNKSCKAPGRKATPPKGRKN